MPSNYEKRILRVLGYIHDNPDGDLSLDNLAEVAAMSRFHWHRVFHAMTGETCAQAVRRLRLYRAARWLAHKDWPIAEVAAKVGYPNVNSFSRSFQEEYGLTPARFRKEGHPGPLKNSIIKGKNKMFEIEIKDAPERHFLAVAHKGPYYEISKSFDKLFSHAPSFNGRIKGTAAVYYDDPNLVAEADLSSHACVWTDEGVATPDGLESLTISSGSHAVLTYKGPYDTIKTAYDHLFGHWLPQSGREPADAPCYELYLNNPMQTKPEDLLTEIYLPLAG